MIVDFHPPDHPLWRHLEPLARHAIESLELAAHLRRVLLCADDLGADDRPWLDLGSARELTLYFHPDAVAKDRLAVPGGGRPGGEWQLRPVARREAPWRDEDFALAKAQRLLHEQFLLARDVCDGSLRPQDVPVSLAEAFQEAWLVRIGGRLRRAGLPGPSEGERRGRFLHLFATGGVVTPGHWQVFHDLWEGRLAGQGDVLRAVRRLPALRRLG